VHELIPVYRELHAQGRFPGYSIAPYLDRIGELVRDTGATSLLDYGCGGGKQYTKKRWHKAWGGLMPKLYDPAVAGYDAYPTGRFDGVIATEVLEHIPEDEIDDVIGELVTFARSFCFVSVCCRKAKPNKPRLPDGRNLHVTIRPPRWWRNKLSAAFDGGARFSLAITP
jgi:hypothetical protein